MRKRLLFTLPALCLALLPGIAPAAEIIASGKCGDNLTWSYQPNILTLTIDGTGSMYDYTHDEPVPWYNYRDKTAYILLVGDMDRIGNYAFAYCTSMTRVTFFDTVTDIGDGAFSGCTALKNVYYRGTASQWDRIGIGGNNAQLLNATFHFDDDTDMELKSTDIPFYSGLGEKI